MGEVLNHEPPFTKRRCGKLYVWARDLEVAYAFAQREGLAFELRDIPYQVARLTGDGVRILIYPHKVQSTGNVHLRVRDENSANKAEASRLMTAMNGLVIGCTFSRKNH